MELNVQSEHSSAKHKKAVKDSNSTQHLTGCILMDVCMKFHYPIGLGVQTRHCSAKCEK